MGASWNGGTRGNPYEYSIEVNVLGATFTARNNMKEDTWDFEIGYGRGAKVGAEMNGDGGYLDVGAGGKYSTEDDTVEIGAKAGVQTADDRDIDVVGGKVSFDPNAKTTTTTVSALGTSKTTTKDWDSSVQQNAKNAQDKAQNPKDAPESHPDGTVSGGGEGAPRGPGPGGSPSCSDGRDGGGYG